MLPNPENLNNEAGTSANVISSTSRRIAIVSSNQTPGMPPPVFEGEFRTTADLMRAAQIKDGMSITVVESNRTKTPLSVLVPEQVLPLGDLTVYLSPSQMSGAILL